VKKFIGIVLIIALVSGVATLNVWLKKRRIEKEYNQAVVLHEEGKTNDAKMLFEKIKDIRRFNPYKEDALYHYALLADNEGVDDQKVIWEQILNETTFEQRRAVAMMNIARISFESQRYDAAKEQLQQLIDQYSAVPHPYAMGLYYLGELERMQGLRHYLPAREYYKKVIEVNASQASVSLARARLGEVNIALLFSPVITPESRSYTVNPGDSLAAIANRFNTTIELLKRSNQLTSNFIRPGDQLKVPDVKWKMEISKKHNTLRLFANDEFFKEYLVGTGKYNKTPVGTFEIINKLTEPVWYRPEGGVIPYGHPDNLLGTRWMGINFPGYGIHGTWDETSVGKQSSAGCVRLINSEVEELFLIVTPGTQVLITDE
jgi:LysM repeat protein